MTIISITYVTESPNTLIRSSRWNTNFTDITTFVNNNNIDGTDNIKAGGVITASLANLCVTDAKIAGIVTAGKVDGAAIVNLPNVPSGAGILPTVNIDTGTTAGKVVKLDGSAKLPAVDGSQLTGITGSQISSLNIISSPISKTAGTIYQASTDGFIIGNAYNTTPQGCGFKILTDSSASPSTVAQWGQTLWVSGAPAPRLPFMAPIKKNNYYQLLGLDQSGSTDNTKIENYNFIPLGS